MTLQTVNDYNLFQMLILQELTSFTLIIFYDHMVSVQGDLSNRLSDYHSDN